MNKKEKKKKQLENNRYQGKSGENIAKERLDFLHYDRGWIAERTGRGHDYKITRINPSTGKKEVKYLEIKTGHARLSKKQQNMKKRHGENYIIWREKPIPLSLI